MCFFFMCEQKTGIEKSYTLAELGEVHPIKSLHSLDNFKKHFHYKEFLIEMTHKNVRLK